MKLTVVVHPDRQLPQHIPGGVLEVTFFDLILGDEQFHIGVIERLARSVFKTQLRQTRPRTGYRCGPVFGGDALLTKR